MSRIRLSHCLSLLLLMILWVGCSHPPSTPGEVPLSSTEPASAQRQPDPNGDRFLEEVLKFRGAVVDPEDTRPVVLCIGSSSFRLWKAQEALPDYMVYNFGFGGSHFSDVNTLWPELACPVEPRFVLVYEGDNDVADGKSVFQVYEDFLETMGRIQAAYPAADILIVPVKPSPTRVQYWDAACKLNLVMFAYAEERGNVHYVTGIADKLLDRNGQPNPSLYSDGLHLNEAGYQFWNTAIREQLSGLQ